MVIILELISFQPLLYGLFQVSSEKEKMLIKLRHNSFTWGSIACFFKNNMVTHKEELVDILSFSISSHPLKYLGLSLGASFKSKTIWEGVVDKMEKKLSSWKKIYFSRGGCLTLIKRTLSSLPTYFLSLFPLLAGIARRLERLQRNFLWDEPDRESKFHLVNWKNICSPVPRGGLRVKNLMLFNKALLGKWL